MLEQEFWCSDLFCFTEKYLDTKWAVTTADLNNVTMNLLTRMCLCWWLMDDQQQVENADNTDSKDDANGNMFSVILFTTHVKPPQPYANRCSWP